MQQRTVDRAPATVYEWGDLVAKLVHLRLEPPKESHDVAIVPVKDSKVNGPAKAFAIYPAADVYRAVDALVTAVSYEPPKLPVKVNVDDEWKYERDVLFPHGRLSITVDVFLDKPIGVHAQTITTREPAKLCSENEQGATIDEC